LLSLLLDHNALLNRQRQTIWAIISSLFLRFVPHADADMVALARTILYSPRWPWHAAAHLGGHVTVANQYLHCQPRRYADLFE